MTSRTNLFVGNLPSHCDDALLRQCFEPFGSISSLKVMVEPATGQCKGFGFVNFTDPLAAAGAVAGMNNTALDGATLVVKFANDKVGKMPGVPGSMPGMVSNAPPSDNVFVGGVPHEWGEADLNTVFGTCGNILSSLVLVDKLTGKSKGAAMVRFADTETASYAVQTLNGFVVEGTGRRLDVRFADRPEDKGAKQVAKQMGLMGSQMRFSPYGKGGMMGGMMAGMMGGMQGAMRGAYTGVQGGVGPMRAPGMGMDMGFGAGGGAGTGGVQVPKRVDIMPEEGANLHVFGLDASISDLNLYEAFAGYGAIRSVKVIIDPATRTPKGYGFVQFFNAQDAHSAMAALSGVQVGSKTWSVSIHSKKRGVM